MLGEGVDKMKIKVLRMGNEIRVKKTDLILFFIVLLTVEVSYLSYIFMPIKICFLALQTVVIGWGMLKMISKMKCGMEDILIVLFIAMEFIATLMRHHELKELILNTKTLLLLYVSFKYAFSLKPHTYISLLSRYMLILTIANTVSAFLCYPRGLFYYDRFTPSFLLGGDNTSTRIYIIAIAMCFAESIFGGQKKAYFTPLISIINFAVFSFVRDIGNGKLCSLVLIIGYITFHIMRVPMIVKPMKKVILANYVLFLFMVILNKLDIFRWIIVTILHRDMTLSTRTTIWGITIDKILEYPYIGNGYMAGADFESMLPSIIGINAHNTILMVAFIGGMALSIVLLMILYNSTKLYDKKIVDQRFWIFPATFFVMFLRSQVEGGDAVYLIAMVTLISSVTKLYVVESSVGATCVK